MKGIFGYEGKFFTFMDKIGSLFWINLLTFVCCIPVITIGASLTACYYVTLKMVRNEEGYLTKSFFKSFKMNFRQSTVIWLIGLLLGFVFYADIRIINGNAEGAVPFSKVIFIAIGIFSIICLMTGTYVFPILAKFDNTIKNTIKNAFIMSILNLPKTVILILTNALFPALLIAVIMTGKALWTIPIVLCFGISASAYLCSRIFVRIFDKYIPEDNGETEDIGEIQNPDTKEIRVEQ